MSHVSLCVIVIEVTAGGATLPSLSYKAAKYRSMASKDADGTSELVYKKGDKNKSRGLRTPRSVSVETYNGEELREVDNTTSTSPVSTIEVNDASGITEDGDDDSKVSFVSGNPLVEVTKGVLHLYKENERTAINVTDCRSDMLCMLSVPASINCRDLLQFIAPIQANVEFIKIIRNATPNQYMVLIKFKTNEGADLFYGTFHGTTFNSIEEDLCHLAYVSRVETLKESADSCLALVGHTELPTCPVCLERMDESVEGILTILCNHSFHSNCLSKWSGSDASCPVCRHVQTPEMVANNQCLECQSSDSLWICLICGHIGCGRYAQGHAYKHFVETSHCFAIQPDNNRVWDYVGDSFVHRLLQNKADGKLVEVTRGHRKGFCCEEANQKVDSIQLEFTYTLTSQLESQRSFFEEMVSQMRKDMRHEIDSLKRSVDEISESKRKLESKVSIMQIESSNLERKIVQLNKKLSKATMDLKEEKEMNKCLRNDQQRWKGIVTKLEEQREQYIKEKTFEVTDLKEQLRDLMFFLEAQKQIEASPLQCEIVDGKVTVDRNTKPNISKADHRRKR